MEEKLLEALKLIREECKKHSRCLNCPLRNPSDDGPQCSLARVVNPEDWELYGDFIHPTRLFIS